MSLGRIKLCRFGRDQVATLASQAWTPASYKTRNTYMSFMRRARKIVMRPSHLWRFACTQGIRTIKGNKSADVWFRSLGNLTPWLDRRLCLIVTVKGTFWKCVWFFCFLKSNHIKSRYHHCDGLWCCYFANYLYSTIMIIWVLSKYSTGQIRYFSKGWNQIFITCQHKSMVLLQP